MVDCGGSFFDIRHGQCEGWRRHGGFLPFRHGPPAINDTNYYDLPMWFLYDLLNTIII
jgi:hypothetical protein